MTLYMIARTVDSELNNTGFRVFNTDTREASNYNQDEIMNLLMDGEEIQGIEISEQGEVLLNHNNYKRYGMYLDNVGIIGDSPVTIIGDFNSDLYSVVNGNGEVSSMSKGDLLEYAETEGVTNGYLSISNNIKNITPVYDEFTSLKVRTNKEKLKLSQAKASIIKAFYEIDSDGQFSLIRDKVAELPKSLKVMDGITSIKHDTFRLNEFNTLVLPSSLEVINGIGQIQAEKLIISNGTKEIRSLAFDKSKIGVIDIPNSVERIEHNGLFMIRLKRVICHSDRVKNLIDKSGIMFVPICLK